LDITLRLRIGYLPAQYSLFYGRAVHFSRPLFFDQAIVQMQ